MSARPAIAQPTAGPTLAFGGDVIYDAPLGYQLRQRTRQVSRTDAYREVFADLAPVLRAADLTVINLEVPVSARYRDRDPAGESPVFAAPDDFLDALRDAGIDALTVANNHAYDQGVRGLANTLHAAARRQLTTIGSGEDAESAGRAVIVPVGRARVAIAAFTEGSNHRPGRDEEANGPRVAFLRDGTLAESMRRARADAHFVIAVFHWTEEDLVFPRTLMRQAAMRAAEAGADLVIGHGTHVPGRTEVITTTDGRRVQVLHSLGNLLAAMEEPNALLTSREVGVRDAPLALVRTEWRDGRLAIASLQVRHHFIERPSPDAPWRPQGRLSMESPLSIEAELERIARAGCGDACDRRAQHLRRRDLLIREAMRPIEVGLRERREEPTLVAVAPSRAAPRRTEPRAEPMRVRRQTDLHAEPVRAPSIRIPDDDPRLSAFARGVLVAVEFPLGSAYERTIDATLLARIVELMREDRSLRAEIVGYAAAHEENGLAEARARRVKGLIAIRGPSRARFSTRGGRQSGLLIRLTR